MDLTTRAWQQYAVIGKRLKDRMRAGLTVPRQDWQHLITAYDLAKHLDEYGQADVPLEIWVLHGAEDEACLQWDGTFWEQGTGPVPGDAANMNDTHINCRCTRDPYDGPGF